MWFVPHCILRGFELTNASCHLFGEKRKGLSPSGRGEKMALGGDLSLLVWKNLGHTTFHEYAANYLDEVLRYTPENQDFRGVREIMRKK
ncbi:hypothetical protein CCP3SC1_80049 [Gammaproteobacteria bacterium]